MCWLDFCQLDTSYVPLRRGNQNGEKCLHQISYMQVCRAFSELIINIGRASLFWVVSSLERWTWDVYESKQSRSWRKTVRSISPWPPLQFLPRGSCLEFRPWFLFMSKSYLDLCIKQTPFFTISFWSVFYHSNKIAN